MSEDTAPIEEVKTEGTTKPVFENNSKNPLAKMFVTDNTWYLNRHKSNLEGMFYNFLSDHEQLNVWSVKASVYPVSEIKPDSMIKAYNDYVSEARRIQNDNKDFEVYCVRLEFDIDG